MKDSLYLYAQRGFLRDLLFNNISNAREIVFLKKMLHIDVNINTVLVLTIDNFYSLTYNKSELQKQKLKMNVQKSLEKLSPVLNMYVINVSEELFAILLRIERNGDNGLEKSYEIGQLLIDKIREETGLAVSIGVGRPYTDIQNIHLSYKEALSAGSRKFFSAGSQVIHVSQVLPYSEDLGIFSQEIESELTVNILSCNYPEAINTIQELLRKSLHVNQMNPLLLKIRLIEIATMMIKVALDTGASVEKLSEISVEAMRKLLQSDTIHELTVIINKSVEGIGKEIFATRKRKNLTSFENSLRYIHDNYQNQISLEKVANHVHLNIYYFSHGFKSFTGMSFIDFLTKVRMEEAKKLLLAGETSVSEIAKKVGYLNANYFGRVFKNTTGVPPSKYKLYLEQNEKM